MLIQNQTVGKTQNIVTTNKTQGVARFQPKNDIVSVENFFINKKPLIDRKIINENQDINEFYNKISSQIFPNSYASHSFSNLLQMGYVSLSSNAYANLKNPKSAIALEIDSKKTSSQHCAKLEEYIKNGIGVGINFSNFDNPTEAIKRINTYFKFREPNVNRPPAGIALLNIDHPKITEFICLKDSADYKNWCFDLSVVMDDSFLKKVDNNENLQLTDGSVIKAKEVYLKLLDSISKSGEPGIIFSNNKNFICDSCAASELNANEGLNLAQVNLSRFYNSKTKKIDYDFLSQSANVLSLALKKIAPNGFISILGYQDLLNQMEINYGSKDALNVLENCLKTIKLQADSNNIRMAISPSGLTSRLLKTTPSIEPFNNPNSTYWDEIETMATAQKYLDGGISKTITLKQHHTIQDIDLIIRQCQSKNIKGISLFPYDKISHTKL